MRLVKISSYYKAALEYYYSQHPQIISLSYYEQLSHLLNFGLGWADFYSRALRKLGWKAQEIIANAWPLEQMWAKENNFSGTETEIVLEQIRRAEPDVVWFQDSINFDSEFIAAVRKLPSVKLIIGNSCSPYSRENIKAFRKFDFLTTCSPKFVKEYSDLGLNSLLLYQAFDPEILEHIEQGPKKFDVIFIGSLIVGREYHNERIDFLQHLLHSGVNMRIHANIVGSRPMDILKKQMLFIIKKILDTTGLYSLVKNQVWYRKSLGINEFPVLKFLGRRLKQSINPPLFGINMYQTLTEARICLNQHGRVAGDYAANMRMFESTGVGTLLLTENKKNISDLFVPDEEIVVYNNFDEAAEKIRWLLNNPQKIEQIAQAGQRRTLREHTYLNRAKKLVEEIEKYL